MLKYLKSEMSWIQMIKKEFCFDSGLMEELICVLDREDGYNPNKQYLKKILNVKISLIINYRII